MLLLSSENLFDELRVVAVRPSLVVDLYFDGCSIAEGVCKV